MNNVAKAIALKKELDTLRPIKKEDELRIMQKLRLNWNYHSNHLEGNRLSYGETKALIFYGITADGKPLRDHFEITGHNEAIVWVTDIVKQDRPLTENFIRELHTLILKEPYERDAITPDGKPTKKTVHVGIYKTTPNHVKTRTGEIFRFATPEETPVLMKDLLEWYRTKIEDKTVNPILLAAEFHYRYIRIHPFDDGNGRTARILMNFILMQFDYPPVIIKTQDKQNYFSALEQADAGMLEPFIEYLAENLIHSLEIMIKGAKGQSIEEPEDLEKEIMLLEQRLKTAGKMFEVIKSKETLIDLYENTISRCIMKYIEKSELFDKFYRKSDFTMYIDSILFKSKTGVVSKGYARISEKTSYIKLVYNHWKFDSTGFDDEFSFSSGIHFQLYSTKYTVGSKAKVVYEKSYGEQLNEKEIDHLISFEIRKHKDFIEKKIEALKNNKPL